MSPLSPDHTVEDVLRLITDRAAFLRYFGNSAAVNHEVVPDARAFSGLADACEDIEAWARAIHAALDVGALSVPLGSGRSARRNRGRDRRKNTGDSD
jgi:hypothetical protein